MKPRNHYNGIFDLPILAFFVFPCLAISGLVPLALVYSSEFFAPCTKVTNKIVHINFTKIYFFKIILSAKRDHFLLLLMWRVKTWDFWLKSVYKTLLLPRKF